jgi:hypothetical protein
LFEKALLFRSTNPGLFFVNFRFMFNRDRLALVKGYRLKATSKQGELSLEEPTPSPALAKSANVVTMHVIEPFTAHPKPTDPAPGTASDLLGKAGRKARDSLARIE